MASHGNNAGKWLLTQQAFYIHSGQSQRGLASHVPFLVGSFSSCTSWQHHQYVPRRAERKLSKCSLSAQLGPKWKMELIYPQHANAQAHWTLDPLHPIH